MLPTQAIPLDLFSILNRNKNALIHFSDTEAGLITSPPTLVLHELRNSRIILVKLYIQVQTRNVPSTGQNFIPHTKMLQHHIYNNARDHSSNLGQRIYLSKNRLRSQEKRFEDKSTKSWSSSCQHPEIFVSSCNL